MSYLLDMSAETQGGIEEGGGWDEFMNGEGCSSCCGGGGGIWVYLGVK